jgi:hypothetical protein
MSRYIGFWGVYAIVEILAHSIGGTINVLGGVEILGTREPVISIILVGGSLATLNYKRRNSTWGWNHSIDQNSGGNLLRSVARGFEEVVSGYPSGEHRLNSLGLLS